MAGLRGVSAAHSLAFVVLRKSLFNSFGEFGAGCCRM